MFPEALAECVNRVAMTAAVASSLPGVWVRWGGALLEPRAAAPSGSGRASLLPCRWVLDVTQGLTKARTAGHFLQPSSHVGPAVLRQLQPEAAQRAEAPSEDGGVPPHTAPDTAVSRAPSKHTPPPSPLLFPVSRHFTGGSRGTEGPPLQPVAPVLWAGGLGRALGPVLRQGAPAASFRQRSDAVFSCPNLTH